MATISFNIPDAKLTRVRDWLKGHFNTEWHNLELANPGWTDLQLAKEVLRNWIVNQIYRYEVRAAMNTAQAEVVKDDAIAS